MQLLLPLTPDDVLSLSSGAVSFFADRIKNGLEFSIQDLDLADRTARKYLAELREAGREYATRTYRYDETARGDAMQADGFLKAIIDLEGKILGCHIIGPEASDLIQEVVVAMTAGSGQLHDIRESVHIHPALSEVVQRGFSGQFSRVDTGHSH